MEVVFSQLAEKELEDATRYYELELQGLGKRFRKEVRKAAESCPLFLVTTKNAKEEKIKKELPTGFIRIKRTDCKIRFHM